MKKNGMKKWLALGLASATCFSFVACGTGSGDDGNTAASGDYAYMAIDINPTVEFVLKGGEVVSVDAVNDDAAALVSAEDFIGKTAEEVSASIVELAQQLGYLNESNTSVKITVAADDEAYASELEEKAKKGAKRGSDIAKVNSEPRSADSRTEKKLKEKAPDLYDGLSAQKVRLIEAIMRYDETMTYEIGAEMSFNELADMLEDLVEEYKDLVGDQLKDEFKAAVEAKKAEVEAAVAEIYGVEYKAAWDKYQALEAAYELIEKSAENMTISEADIETIMTALGIEDVALISEGDIVTVESVDRYVDKNCDDDRATSKEEEDELEKLEDTIEDILEKYDEDEYLLTADDVASLDGAWGEALGLAEGDTLEDAEEVVEDKEDALEELKESVTLTAEQKEAIAALKAGMKDHKAQAHREMKDRIEELKNEFHNVKEERKEQHGDKNRGEEGEAPVLPEDQFPEEQKPVEEGVEGSEEGTTVEENQEGTTEGEQTAEDGSASVGTENSDGAVA